MFISSSNSPPNAGLENEKLPTQKAPWDMIRFSQVNTRSCHDLKRVHAFIKILLAYLHAEGKEE
ncbi:unnamed protein product [Nesidiocoris tenuis]|uniref:Uncharacterized protein n=1 Tax=Nesidiocoris tenuis TaxID=355587 RepID=A0A6H5HLR7_9HEMI|nr:unnamed protein product [Nesidiocoris tenuis]